METIATAAISFVAAVAAVVIGQFLGQKYQRDADDRRWDREDAGRRRTHSEEIAREAVDLLNQTIELFSSEAGRQRAKLATETPGRRRRRYEPPSYEETRPTLDRLRRIAIEIDDRQVREFLVRASDLLSNNEYVHQYGGSTPRDLSQHVWVASRDVLGAFLRGDRLPPSTAIEGDYEAMEAFWKDVADEAELA
jgi:hypothetical protein